MVRALRKIRRSLWWLTAPIWVTVGIGIRKWRIIWLDKEGLRKNKRVLKVGHRGAMGYAPENTLASFKKALDLKVDMVELDVHCCATGEIVAIHDTTLERTTNGKGYVMKSDFATLRSLNAGDGQCVPTLSEVLDLIDRKSKVNIELKGMATAEPVSRIIREYIDKKGWKPEMFWISSFSRYELEKFREIEPKIRISYLITRIRRGCLEFAEKINAYSISVFLTSASRKFIDAAHNRGLKVIVWTVNHKDDIKRMRSLGVDGIISNFPDRI